jgi:hypothetical protein
MPAYLCFLQYHYEYVNFVGHFVPDFFLIAYFALLGFCSSVDYSWDYEFSDDGVDFEEKH